MFLSEDYPKTHRNQTETLRAVLSHVPGLSPRHAEDYALAINDLADKARDLDEIFSHLLRGGRDAEELAEILTAFELTTEQIRGSSDAINGKLYDLADRLRQGARTGSNSP
jgi:hypothetical protein